MASTSVVSNACYIPPELVELIMRHLDGKTFTTCRRVCKLWRQIADRLSQEMDIWEKFCISDFPDAWANIDEKGDLAWLDVYVNIYLWTKIKTSWVIKKLFQSFSNTLDKQIITINVNKVGLLNVTLRNSIKIYDISTFLSSEEIIGQYFCYFENEFVKVIHSYNHTLFLKPNTVQCPISDGLAAIDNVYLFRVVSDTCYYVTLKQELWIYQFRLCKTQSILVKWYNSDTITAIDIYKHKIYLLTHSGKILTYDRNRLIKVRDVKWPYDSRLYQKFYLCRGNIFFYCDYATFYISIPNGKEMTYTGFFASCILFHGNILVIGTYFGLISLYLINNTEDLLKLNQITPIVTHLLCVEFPIAGIDVYEEEGTHSLFAWTRSNIFKIKYKYESTFCAETVLCNSLELCTIVNNKCSESNNYDLNSNDDAT